jgi:hypothetical protein
LALIFSKGASSISIYALHLLPPKSSVDGSLPAGATEP